MKDVRVPAQLMRAMAAEAEAAREARAKVISTDLGCNEDRSHDDHDDGGYQDACESIMEIINYRQLIMI